MRRQKALVVTSVSGWLVAFVKSLGDEDLALPGLLGCLRSLYLGMSCGIAQVSSDSVL